MKTKVQSPEKKWELKDRVYVLKGDMSPITYTIQTRHTPRKPLLYWDEEKGMNRELRLASNQKSLFVDEQDGYSTLQHLIFQDGVLNVPRTEPLVCRLALNRDCFTCFRLG